MRDLLPLESYHECLISHCSYDGLGRRITKTEFDKNLSITERYNYEGLSLTLAGTDTIKGNVNPENIKQERTEVGRYRPVDGYQTNNSQGNPTGARNFATRGLQIVSENGTRGQINYTTDLRGSVRYETTTKDSKTETYNYDVFGESIGKTPEFFGYTGKPFDPQTKMYNYGYRDYAPKTARFSTIDPIRDGANWFSYVGQDPVNFVDPDGRDRTAFYDLIGKTTSTLQEKVSTNYSKILNSENIFTAEIRVDIPGKVPRIEDSASQVNGDGGHAFIGLTHIDGRSGSASEIVRGFYGVPPLSGVFRPTSTFPGRVQDDSKSPYDYSFDYQISERSYYLGLIYMGTVSKIPAEENRYSLWYANCVDFVIEVGKAVGIEVPESGLIGNFLSNPYNLASNLLDKK